jgi:hypothetical protein
VGLKLLLWGYCKDVRAVGREMTTCCCGKTRAQYRDDGWHADIWGDDCTMLGLENGDRYGLLAGRTVEIHPQGEDHPRVTYHREPL